MKTIMTVVLAMAATAALSVAADKANFSGDWTMDANKSDFGPIPPPATMTRKVEHTDPAINVVTVQTGGAQGDATITQKFSTDGKETTNELMGSPTKSTAKWDGKALVIATKADFQGTEITINMKWSLSDDGKVLTDAWHIVSPQGEFDVTYVLNKK
jgi:hypothetical protein